jgi:hypothetical protein
VLQRARLRRNVGKRRFFRARPRRHFWLSRAGLAREPRPQTGELAPHELMAGRSHPRPLFAFGSQCWSQSSV